MPKRVLAARRALGSHRHEAHVDVAVGAGQATLRWPSMSPSWPGGRLSAIATRPRPSVGGAEAVLGVVGSEAAVAVEVDDDFDALEGLAELAGDFRREGLRADAVVE